MARQGRGRSRRKMRRMKDAMIFSKQHPNEEGEGCKVVHAITPSPDPLILVILGGEELVIRNNRRVN